MPDGEIELIGEFSDEERALLMTQFGRCRCELVKRAARDPAVVAVRWSAPEQRFVRASTGPLSRGAIPAEAYYVLRTGVGAGLRRVNTAAELERELGQPVPEADFSRAGRHPGSTNAAWESVRQALGGLLPWRAGQS